MVSNIGVEEVEKRKQFTSCFLDGLAIKWKGLGEKITWKCKNSNTQNQNKQKQDDKNKKQKSNRYKRPWQKEE